MNEMKKDWIKNVETIIDQKYRFWISVLQLYERLKLLNEHIKVGEIITEIEHKNESF